VTTTPVGAMLGSMLMPDGRDDRVISGSVVGAPPSKLLIALMMAEGKAVGTAAGDVGTLSTLLTALAMAEGRAVAGTD